MEGGLDGAYGMLCGPPAAELHSGEPHWGGGVVNRRWRGSVFGYILLAFGRLTLWPRIVDPALSRRGVLFYSSLSYVCVVETTPPDNIGSWSAVRKGLAAASKIAPEFLLGCYLPARSFDCHHLYLPLLRTLTVMPPSGSIQVGKQPALLSLNSSTRTALPSSMWCHTVRPTDCYPLLSPAMLSSCEFSWS